MRLDDARRLTGPNLYGPRPLVLLELWLDAGETAASVRDVLQDTVTRLRTTLGLPPVTLRIARAQPGWVALVHDAPLDEMLVSAEVLERAITGEPLVGLALHPEPRLLALEAEAARRRIPFVWDDTTVSLGHGRSAVHFARDAIPPTVEWSSLGSIPIAMVTGTNGKTTSTRLLARMVQEAGFAVGSTTSDAVTIAGRVLHEGDWTGPAAAREVLRSPEVEIAILETARGGILRRGLACDAIDVALITNISDDHLGSFGVNTLQDMAEVKAVIARVARHVVLNARDPLLRSLSLRQRGEGRGEGPLVTYFADLDANIPRPTHPRLVIARGDRLISIRDGVETELLPISSIPITFNGTARYNLENALGATAAAEALGIPHAAIIRALSTFTSADNPGRGETWTRAGVTLFLDFAHNPDGVGSALHVAAALLGPGGRLTVITGSAGDRTDAELTAVSARIQDARPAAVYVRELEHYLRGRQPHEVSAFFERTLGATRATSEVDALTRATRSTRPGDVIALLVHVDRDEVRTFLEAEGWARR
jgi:UDP-N-acetylmuramyl tripeptide synthase